MFIAFNIILILMVLLIAYWWANQGLFSAIIHLLCVVVAGAVALAFWEPVTVGMLLRGGGFDSYAWGVSLVVMFVLVLLVLRILSNKLIPANVQLPHWANLAFGFPVGAMSGVLTVGLLVIGMGMIQSENRLLGFAGYSRGEAGAVAERNRLWLPVHQMTDEFYSLLSVGAFSTGRPLRHYQPELYQLAGSLARDTFKGGRGQIAMPPSQASATATQVCPSRCLVSVRFSRGALDYGEQLTLSASQVRLISAVRGMGRPHVAYPARWRQPTGSGEQTFRFDDPSHYVSTLPGRENVTILFEFPWPDELTPRFIQIKAARIELGRVEKLDEQQCQEVLSGAGGSVASGPPTDVYGAKPLGSRQIRVSNDIQPVMVSTNMLPGSMKEQDNYLVEGRATFDAGQQTISRNLLVQGIYETPGTRVVQLEVDRTSEASMFGRERKLAGDDATPHLVDSEGNTYTAIGYIHQGNEGVTIRLSPKAGIGSVGELPHLPTTGNQHLRLIFRVSQGVTIAGVRLGDIPVARCNLQIPVDD